jgi:hypothetical protein
MVMGSIYMLCKSLQQSTLPQAPPIIVIVIFAVTAIESPHSEDTCRFPST